MTTPTRVRIQTPEAARSANVGRRVAIGGDSITNGSNASNAAAAFPAMTAVIAGSARAKVTAYGVPGERSDQLLTRVPAILAAGTDHLHVQIGPNDASQGVTLAIYQANISKIVRLAQIAGVSVSIGLVPPRSAAATAANALLAAYNLWLRSWCPKQGIPLADTWTALADPTTGLLAAAYDTDGTHPNTAGHLAMAYAIAPAVAGPQIAVPPFVTAVSPIGLIANPLMSSTTGWSDQGGTATMTVSVEAASGGDGLPAGQWLKCAIDNTAGGGAVNRQRAHTLDASKYSAGDALILAANVKISGNVSAKVQVTNSSTAFAVPLDVSATVRRPGPALFRFAVPASPATLQLGLVVAAAAGASGAAYLGAAQVHNLTTGGLTDAF